MRYLQTPPLPLFQKVEKLPTLFVGRENRKTPTDQTSGMRFFFLPKKTNHPTKKHHTPKKKAGAGFLPAGPTTTKKKKKGGPRGAPPAAPNDARAIPARVPPPPRYITPSCHFSCI